MNVVWKSYNDSPNRGYWDQQILEDLFKEANHYNDYQKTGSVVIIPGRSHADHIKEINKDIQKLPFVILIITGDEEALFPIGEIEHDHIQIWIQTARIEKHPDYNWLPNGHTPHTKKISGKKQGIFFAGQVTHQRRRLAVEAGKALGAEILETEGFTQGWSPKRYNERLNTAQYVLCPSGPVTVDTFRVWEALEVGAIPIVDTQTPTEDQSWYWDNLLEDVPFPRVKDWSTVGRIIKDMDYQERSLQIRAWYKRFKIDLKNKFYSQYAKLSGESDRSITVIIPTSPIPSLPKTTIIDETIKSIRDHIDAQIIVVFDGVRPEQEKFREHYLQYIDRMLDKDIYPIILKNHQHQVGATRIALEHVTTPCILFVEHDTPICEEIPFDGLESVIVSGLANVIRLHHEALILPDHEHLMLDSESQIINGVPLKRSIQWSQRPHMASTDFYRNMLATYFTKEAKSFIEDKMHSVLQTNDGLAGWAKFKLWIYAPDGDMKRSVHLDGREGESKFDDRQQF